MLENHLKEHTKRHTLPYFCDKCDSRFGSSLSLKAHTRVVHEQKQIQCRHGCGWSCWESSNRNRHEKLCNLNPIPKAPYTISAGTASSLTLQVLSIQKYAKIIKAVNFILCLAELQSEIARGKKRVTKLNPLFIQLSQVFEIQFLLCFAALMVLVGFYFYRNFQAIHWSRISAQQ